MDRSRIAILIPALNEAASIARVVERVAAFGVPFVVDDGSSDGTGALAAAAGASVVVLPANRGYDGALDAGMAAAIAGGFEVVVTIDADGQHDPERVRNFADAIDSGADVVVGVRGRYQRASERLFAAWTKRRFGIRDPLCGMKAYRSDVAIALGHFDSYRSIGTELLLFAARSGRRIVELPCPVTERIGAPRFGGRLRGNARILRSLAIAVCRSTRRAPHA